MAEAVAVSQETLTNSLKLLVDYGRGLLEKLQQEAKESLEDLIPHKINSSFGLLTAAAEFYKSIGVKNKAEAEAVWQKFYQHAEVREQVDELLELENEWDSFLESVDNGLKKRDWMPDGKIAESLSPDFPFIEAHSQKSVTLGQYLEEGKKLLVVLHRFFGWPPWHKHLAELQANIADLEAQSVQVLVVAFGAPEGVQKWREITGSNFNLVLDRQRKLYRSFGQYSFYGKWMKFSNMLSKAEKVFELGGSPVVVEDVFQLGGDIVLDGTGKVLYRHLSKDPWDRPLTADILQALALSQK